MTGSLSPGRAMLAWLIAWVVRAWIASLRFDRMGATIEGPCLVAFWHGDQLALLGHRPKGSVVAPISLSRDGRMQARIMKRFGIGDVPGSSSRGAFGAARNLLRALAGGSVALMAVDGPRGPRLEVKAGVSFLARKAGVPVFPAAIASAIHTRLGSWDRFLLPLPFSRIVVCIGQPIRLEASVSQAEGAARISAGIHAAQIAATSRLHK